MQCIHPAARGDRAAFEALVREYLPQAYRVAYGIVRNREDAEDVVQDAFVKAWRHLGTFDSERRFSPWFLQIVKRTALDALRKKAAVPFSALGWDSPDQHVVDATQRFEDIGERMLLGDRLVAAMRRVSDTAVAIIRAHDVNGFTFAAIAQQRGKPLSTVQSQHRRAVTLLRKLLECR